MKAGIFDRPQVRRPLDDKEFKNVMTFEAKNTWQTFAGVVLNFLGNRKRAFYRSLVRDHIESYKALGVNTSLKMHFCPAMWTISENLGAINDEQAKVSHQDIEEMEER